jgi:hypothetical protein
MSMDKHENRLAAGALLMAIAFAANAQSDLHFAGLPNLHN